MTFASGAARGAVDNAIARERYDQSNHDHQSSSRDSHAYTLHHQQLPCPCLGTHLPRYRCDSHRVHEAHVSVSRREFKREWREAWRDEHHTRRAEMFRQPGCSGMRPATVYTDHLPGYTESSSLESNHHKDLFRGTARDLSQSIGRTILGQSQNNGQSSSNTTARASCIGAEAATPPVYIGNRPFPFDEGDFQNQSDAPPPYEQFPVDVGRERSVEASTSGRVEKKMP